MIRRTAFVAALALVAASPFAHAGSPGAEAPTATAAERALCAGHGDKIKCLVVLVDHLQRVELPAGVTTMLIGNPAIADVSVVSNTQAVVSARSVGSTNMLFLDESGDEVGHYVLIVREQELKRVTLRRGPGQTAMYQCAPRCERTLNQNDSAAPHAALAGILDTENGINAAAVGESATDETVIDDGPQAVDE